jgi:hypothetical protein
MPWTKAGIFRPSEVSDRTNRQVSYRDQPENADIAQQRAHPADAKRRPVIVVSHGLILWDTATVKRHHYDDHDQLRRHLADFVNAYNFARRLKTLKASRLTSSSANPGLLSPNHSI